MLEMPRNGRVENEHGDSTTEAHEALRVTMKEIESLDKQMALLEKQRDILTQRATLLRYTLAPIRKLPDYVLSEIFISCLPHDHDAVMSIRAMPLLFTRVCRHWRDLALSTVSLWSSLHIVLDSHSDWASHCVSPLKFDKIAQWLDRSGSCPLSITITCARNTLQLRSRCIPPIKNLISLYAPRIRSLSSQHIGKFERHHRFVRNDSDSESESESDNDNESDNNSTTPLFPILEHLRNPLPFFTLHNSTALLFGQQLRSLHLDLTECKELYFNYIQWGRLTTLNLTHAFNAKETLLLLERCPRLQSCHLRCYYNQAVHHNSEGEYQSVNLLSLSDLSLEESTDCHILRFLRLPNLRNLDLMGCEIDEVYASALECPFSLHSLTPRSLVYDVPKFCQFLSTQRELKMLAYSFNEFQDDNIILSMIASRRQALPGLERMELRLGCYGFEHHFDALLHLLQSNGHKNAENHRFTLVLIVRAESTELCKKPVVKFTRAKLEILHYAAAESTGSQFHCEIQLSDYHAPRHLVVRDLINSPWLYTGEEDDPIPHYERELVVPLSQGLKDWEPVSIAEVI
jgi:hypothetical protein